MTKNDTARTLSARYHKDGSEILVSQGSWKNPRRLTPRECARLMGYPEDFKITVSDTQAYRQFGNSVVMPVVERIAECVLASLQRPMDYIPEFVLQEKKNSKAVSVAPKPVTYEKPKRKKK